MLPDDLQLPDRPVPILQKNVLTAWLEITLRERLNRLIQRETAAGGHPMVRRMRAVI